jgi:putative hydrolase of the HAD superfamily
VELLFLRGRCFDARMQNIRVIGLDADDTLWHNETIFERVHERYRALLARYHDTATVDRTLLATEARNLELYGYGVKGFTLSAIETAIELTEGKISADEIRTLLDLGREMLDHPVELLPHVAEVVAQLAVSHRLLLITKGDLRDQQRKLKKSGLSAHFSAIEIVSEKDPDTYAGILRRHQISPAEFLMVGNSLKSDVLTVLAIGGSGVHIPYHLLWSLEHSTQMPEASDRFATLETIRDLPTLLCES